MGTPTGIAVDIALIIGFLLVLLIMWAQHRMLTVVWQEVKELRKMLEGIK